MTKKEIQLELETLTHLSGDKTAKTFDSIKNTLDYLRISIKLLLHDLESTARERDELRKKNNAG